MHDPMSTVPASWPSTLRHDDRGFLMVEILVSAAILIVVSLAAFMVMDQNDKLAGDNQRRAIAANMVQAEMERVRSLPIEDVARLSGTTTVIGPGGPKDEYYLTSKTRWITDNADEPNCATRSGGLDYMRLTTVVSWRKMNNAKPISMTTLITPSSRSSSSTAGSLSVNVIKADGSGVSGLPISIDGVQNFTETTNINGCVVFPFVPAGNYQLEFARPGWVDGDNVNAIDQTVSVAAGQTNKLEYNYDQGGYTRMNFVTGRRGSAPDFVKSYPETVALFNSVQTSAPFKVDLGGTVDSWNSQAANVPLFPSASPYVIYTGQCPNGPPSGTTGVNVPAGGMQGAGTVQVPSLDVMVWTGTPASPGSPANGAKVVVTSGCGADIVKRTGPDGRLADPGFPYGLGASVCVSFNNRLRAATVDIKDFTANPQLTQYFLGAGSPNVVNNATCAG